MAGAKTEEKTWLNYRILPLVRQFFDTISSAQVVASKEWQVFSSQNFCEDVKNYLPFIMHSKIMKHNSFPEWFWTRVIWTGWILNFISYNFLHVPSYFVLEKPFCFLSFCKYFLISSIVTIRISVLFWGIRMSLERPTSRSRRTESTVSLERGGLLMCRIASRFLLHMLKGSMSGNPRDFNNIGTRPLIKFFFL